MFKFGFSNEEENGNNYEEKTEKLTWFAVSEIPVTEKNISKEFDPDDSININISDVNLRLLNLDKTVLKLDSDKHDNIIKAESQHSDLIPAIYEGGLKIWECSYDLGKYLISNNIDFENKKVLDLGCGAGVLGIIALLKGAIVHFQDYNTDVIELMTIPNVLLNLNDRNSINDRTKFYSGDWGEFTKYFNDKNSNEKYDIILTSETIYNSENHKKLYQVFENLLNDDGIVYLAGKTFYFGVGGGMRQFENIINEEKKFDIKNIWKSQNGVQREIMKLVKHQYS
ncbi:hypothetical protein HCN44_010285 [Aphidius gifuensis]|uniref:protein-histidine N-methyltransferase n=1 Tax=Aphidius gifuensis TaxID=684658 RepID=A0A834XUI0_APHGI|nr:histidine protein methyltransferase 1 homolog [Aphidius gifuensis]KAF7993690.1 hypothetical protein HCN44_010285 [Aphidius gifuensis]